MPEIKYVVIGFLLLFVIEMSFAEYASPDYEYIIEKIEMKPCSAGDFTLYPGYPSRFDGCLLNMLLNRKSFSVWPNVIVTITVDNISKSTNYLKFPSYLDSITTQFVICETGCYMPDRGRGGVYGIPTKNHTIVIEIEKLNPNENEKNNKTVFLYENVNCHPPVKIGRPLRPEYYNLGIMNLSINKNEEEYIINATFFAEVFYEGFFLRVTDYSMEYNESNESIKEKLSNIKVNLLVDNYINKSTNVSFDIVNKTNNITLLTSADFIFKPADGKSHILEVIIDPGYKIDNSYSKFDNRAMFGITQNNKEQINFWLILALTAGILGGVAYWTIRKKRRKGTFVIFVILFLLSTSFVDASISFEIQDATGKASDDYKNAIIGNFSYALHQLMDVYGIPSPETKDQKIHIIIIHEGACWGLTVL